MELYRRLPSAEVHVAAPETDGATAFDAAAGIAVHRLPLRLSGWGVLHPRSVWQYARALRRLRAVASRVRPDAIHCAKCLPEGLLGLAIARQHGLPLVCYAHGEELTLAKTSRELAALTGRVLRAAVLIVANSQFTRQLLLEDWRVPAEKVVVMHPGVDTGRFAPAPPADDVRLRLGWAGRRVVLTVGALQKRKGQDMLIRALPRIREACPNVLYAMVGEGWEQEYLERLVDEQGVRDLVQFRGAPNDSELVECYQQCDVFALPGRQVGWDVEGFGIVLLEAQACGKPALAGVSGGASETLIAGVTGELVDGDVARSHLTSCHRPARGRRSRPADGRAGTRVGCGTIHVEPGHRAGCGSIFEARPRMKVSLYTFVKDGIYGDFHVVAMIRHHLPFADEIIVNEGYPRMGHMRRSRTSILE